MSRIRSWFKSFLADVYFGIFPSQLEKKMSTLSVFSISDDDTKLKFWLKVTGPEKVVNRLLEESGNGYATDCHQAAHQIGRVAFSLLGQRAFGRGDASCHSGYYHGAMEEFLKTNGTRELASKITALCNDFETYFETFECLHGVGHGVMAYEAYNIPKALDQCGSLYDDFARSSCYGGVFMENIAAGKGAGAIAGHETEWVNHEDPHFPCNAVGDDYNIRFQCYQMQTSWMLHLNEYDFDKTAEWCEEADKDMVSVCFKSLGRDVAGYTLRQPQKIVELCDVVPRNQDYYNQCITGAANVIIDFWGPKLTDQADGLCALLDEDNKSVCYSLVNARKQEMVKM